jgi:hypothetical protein
MTSYIQVVRQFLLNLKIVAIQPTVHQNKLFFVILIAVFAVVSGCGGLATESQLPRQYGQAQKSVVGRSEQRLAEFNGWRVYTLTDGNRTTCMAIKPAPQTPWPQLSRGSFWEARLPSGGSQAHRMLRGGAGFYMYLVNQSEIPYFGFYGKYPFRLPSIARQNETIIYDTNNRATVLSWEGSEIDFTVTTQATENRYDNQHEASGTIDFSGVGKAYELISVCHGRTW